jgi:hypothetical protein
MIAALAGLLVGLWLLLVLGGGIAVLVVLPIEVVDG